MILGFKTEINGEPTGFVGKILASFIPEAEKFFTPKRHTIRNGNRWKAGDKIHFAIGVRTKHYLGFHEGVCKAVQTIEIYDYNEISLDEARADNMVFLCEKTILGDVYYSAMQVKVDGRRLSLVEIKSLAVNDGFACAEQFFGWFGNKDFTGQLIHWTDLRY